MAFRFVHTADIHLDSPLKSLALRHEGLGALIANATRQAFVRIVDLCLDEAVDALLIAGDLYDGDQTSMKTARFFAEQLYRLDAAGIRTFILRGNHDALSKITRELVLPASVFTFGGRADAIVLDRGGRLPEIVVHGLSFSSPKAPDGLLPKYKAPVQRAVNIGLMHTSLNGAPGHDPYAPCSVSDLDASGFAYWALGHIHKRSDYVGRCTVVMPGNPQGRDINEDGQKSVSLVTVDDDGGIFVEERNVSIAQFERVNVDVSGAADRRDLIETIASALKHRRATVETEHLIVRLRLTGTTPLAWTIRRDLDLIQEDIDLQAEIVGATWIEKVELVLETATPPHQTEAGDTLFELRRLITDEVGQSEGFHNAAEEFAADLVKALPVELRGLLGDDPTTRRDILNTLLSEGTDDVLARLRSPAGAGGVA
ncbi:metallophosphoesterase family protein [Asticcacaulis tiandongensis]|uniref:metallophosphoesterase family protein n=1 Tax=Asticcacaulis tiandongensis TaxID=2565365 RepID=UPI0011283D10|nr:DNA repair exonuclease [Asticcacaulis tiandongensis]